MFPPHIAIETVEDTIGTEITINNENTKKEYEYRLRVESEIIAKKKLCNLRKMNLPKKQYDFMEM